MTSSPAHPGAISDRRQSVTERNHTENKGGGAEALRLQAGEDGKKYDDSGIVRKRTEVEIQVLSHVQQAEGIVKTLEKEEEIATKLPEISLFLPDVLQNAIFVGHIVTDLDSVAGAMGAAALYGGTAALASPINSETVFAFQEWGVPMPQYIEDLLEENPKADICLVDHQQTSQLNPVIPVENIVGVIDHHALQSKTIVTDKPIYMDIRPWGSMSTIIAHTFLTHKRAPPKPIAGMLLCAILSDTLNLLGPTTTEWDRLMVAVLSDIAEVNDIQLLASRQFKAKSRELASLSAVGLVKGDQKSFSFDMPDGGFVGEIGFAVVETTNDTVIVNRVEELMPEMLICKKERGYSCLFLAIVNIVEMHSYLLLCGPSEVSLAQSAFPDAPLVDKASKDSEAILMDLGSRVSRKKDFIPAVTASIKKGWVQPSSTSGMKRVMSEAFDVEDAGTLDVDPNDPYGRIQRSNSIIVKKRPSEKLQPMQVEA